MMTNNHLGRLDADVLVELGVRQRQLDGLLDLGDLGRSDQMGRSDGVLMV